MPRDFTIGQHTVGLNHPPFVIAEMSGNHNGSLDRALDIVRAAAAAGAQAVKIQTYTADTMTLDVDRPEFRVSDDHPLWGGRSLWDLYDEAKTPYEWHGPIFELARSLGVVPFSTPFDASAVDLLESLGQEVYKIASLEITDTPLVRRVAATGKPVILSTGGATLAQVDAAVTAARAAGCQGLVVLACTTSYPAPPEESNLRQIPMLSTAFDVVAGLSDHTMGTAVATAAVALGARVIEKHVTLDRNDGGVDSAFSLEPHELKSLMESTREAFDSLGDGRFAPSKAEAESNRARRSLYVTVDVAAGDEVTVGYRPAEGNVRAVRPGGGLTPGAADEVHGRRFARDVAAGTALTWDLLGPQQN